LQDSAVAPDVKASFQPLREVALVHPPNTNEGSDEIKYDVFYKFYTGIDVFWLSDDAFISRHRVNRRNGPPACAYRLGFDHRGRESLQHKLLVYVYSLSSLERPQFLPEPASLPMDFLRQLTRNLPSDHFFAIHLEWHGSGFPSSLLKGFLSIPSSANNDSSLTHQQHRPDGAPQTQPKTVCFFHNLVTGEQAETVLSCYDANTTELSFGGRNLSEFRNLTPEQAATEMRLLNTALRTATTVRNLSVDSMLVSEMFRRLDAADVPFSVNGSLEMLRIMTNGDHTGVLWVLDGVTRNRGICSLEVHCQFDRGLLEHLLCQVLPGHMSLQSLLLHHNFDNDFANSLEAVQSLLLDLNEQIKKMNLRLFETIFSRRGTRERHVPLPFKSFWDMNVVPVLALNEHRFMQESTGKQVRSGGLLCHELQCVNRGVTYRKVATPASACNMSAANASVIYRLLCETDRFKSNA
jgi:hypothetical protein